MIRDKLLKQGLVQYYELNLNNNLELSRNSSKSFILSSKEGNSFFLKETIPNALEKYHFLANQGVNNVLYPIMNKNNKYVTKDKNYSFYINNYYDSFVIKDEVKTANMLKELNLLHQMTKIKKQLRVNTARPKFDEVTNRLDFCFRVLEDYVRSIESKPLMDYSMPILSNYQYFLNAKIELIKLQKRIISSIKSKESVEYAFIHNNPHIDHLLNIKGINYLTSIEKGKIGLDSLDLAKIYVENDNLNIDFKELIKGYYKSENNPFGYDYFRFLVLLIFIRRINLTSSDYINSTIFTSTAASLRKYFEYFSDNQEEVN